MSKLDELMNKAGISDAELAGMVGASRVQIWRLRRCELANGRRIDDEWAKRIAPHLGSKWYDLIEDQIAPEKGEKIIKPKARSSLHPLQSPSSVHGSYVPLYGSLLVSIEGLIVFSNGPIGVSVAPPSLSDSPLSYAAYVPDQLLEPRYDQGDKILVNPSKPASIGKYAVVRLRARGQGLKDEGVIRKYVGNDAGSYVLATLNPPRTENFPSDEYTLERIAGTVEE